MNRFLRWVVFRLGWINLLLFTFLVAGIWSVAAGIASLVRGLEFLTLVPLIGVAMIAGWILARPSVRTQLWGIAGLAAGGAYVLIQVGGLGPLIGRLVGAFFRFSVQVQDSAWVGLPDPGPVYDATVEFVRAISVVTGRLGDWLNGLPDSLGTFDLVIASLIWSILLWVVSYWAAGVLRRWRRPLLSMVPAGILLSVSLAYAGSESVYLLPFLGATLLLQLMYRLQTFEIRWSTNKVDYHEDIWVDMGAVGASLITLAVFLAMAAPSFSLRPVVTYFRNLTVGGEEPVRSMAGSLGLNASSGDGAVFGAAQYAGLPRQHLIGSGPELRDQIVMTIRKTELSADRLNGKISEDQVVPYWRSLTYDRYNGRGWETGDTELIAYPAGSDFSSEVPSGYRLIQQDADYLEDLNGLLHIAGSPVTMDADVVIAWRGQLPSEGEEGGTVQALEGDIFGIQTDSRTYQVLSLVPVPGSSALKEAGVEYPADLPSVYFYLPASVPDRVLALARDLTVTARTPYDQAIAIESYLRRFPYNLDLPAPPSGVDIADYFLFDLKEGYCDYYATAMVVLARAAGLPARMVMGFAAGNYDRETGIYLVSAADAHSWVEIYFPGYGWIEFEPTGGLPPIERPAEGLIQAQTELFDELVREDQSPNSLLLFRTPGMIILFLTSLVLALAGILLIGGFLIPSIQQYRLNRMGVQDVMIWIFTDLYRQGHRLTVPIEPGDTVYEFSSEFALQITDLLNLQSRRKLETRFKQDLDGLVARICAHAFQPQKNYPFG